LTARGRSGSTPRKGWPRAGASRVGARAPLPVTAQPNERWPLDFARDQLVSGRRFRVLNVMDDVTRECLAAVVDTSISGKRVARELAALVIRRGKPTTVVSDNGTELTSNAVLSWAGEAGIDWHHIAPGKPQQNGYAESFNGRLQPSPMRATTYAGLWSPLDERWGFRSFRANCEVISTRQEARLRCLSATVLTPVKGLPPQLPTRPKRGAPCSRVP